MVNEERSDEGRAASERRGNGCGKGMLFLVLTVLISLPFLAYFAGSKVKRGVIEVIEAAKAPVEPEIVVKEVAVEREKIVKVEVPASPEPLPSKYISRRTIDTAQMYNGLQVRSELEMVEGVQCDDGTGG